MTIAKWLEKSIKTLELADISTAKLDAELLLADILDQDRSWLHAHPGHPLQRSDLHILNKQIERRASHEPIAYIRGRQEFYSREFAVSPDTLTPRPETETMVEMALDMLRSKEVETVADIGSGSGCIVITLALECKSNAKFSGYEISKPAIKLAKANAKKHSSDVRFYETDITEDKPQDWQSAELIVANLPYVPTNFKINTAATHEPDFAIFGGEDGLDYYRVLFSKLSTKATYVFTESLPPQHSDLENMAKNAGFALLETKDLIQKFTRS